MTTATVPARRPWYKQFWPWFIIALPLTSVIAATTCVVIAFKNEDSVVRDDWYEDGKNINITMDRQKHALALGLAATVGVDATTGDVTVDLHAKKPLSLSQLDIKFSHATDSSRDEDVTITRGADGKFHGILARAPKGHYYIDIETKDWKISDEELLPQQGTFNIAAGQ